MPTGLALLLKRITIADEESPGDVVLEHREQRHRFEIRPDRRMVVLNKADNCCQRRRRARDDEARRAVRQKKVEFFVGT